MNRDPAHFIELPNERESLWETMTHFLDSWKNVRVEAQTIDAEELASAVARLDLVFPPGLSEFYNQFGTLVRTGFFNDKRNTLLPPGKFYIEPSGALGSRTLVIAENYWGALWGISDEELANPDPQIRFIDSNGSETDELFSLSEFLVGLLFRSTVINAPFTFVIERSFGKGDPARKINSELLVHFPSWARNNLEKDCGFMSHIEGQEILATLSEESLTIGLKRQDAINALPEPLRSMITDLNPSPIREFREPFQDQ